MMNWQTMSCWHWVFWLLAGAALCLGLIGAAALWVINTVGKSEDDSC